MNEQLTFSGRGFLAAAGTGMPKTADQYKIIGQWLACIDIPAIMTGKAIFVHDDRS